MQKQDEVRTGGDLAEVLRERGLKVTPQRTAVYQAVRNLTSHPSADEVYHKIVESFPNISFDTVNRTLLTFAEIGLIEIIETQEGVRRFDTQTHVHHHILCNTCGRIIDIENSAFNGLSVPEELKINYRVLKLRVSLVGTCPECQLKSG